MSMFRPFSCVFGRGCLLWPVCYLCKTLLAFALLHFVLIGQICLLLQVFLDFLLFLVFKSQKIPTLPLPLWGTAKALRDGAVLMQWAVNSFDRWRGCVGDIWGARFGVPTEIQVGIIAMASALEYKTECPLRALSLLLGDFLPMRTGQVLIKRTCIN